MWWKFEWKESVFFTFGNTKYQSKHKVIYFFFFSAVTQNKALQQHVLIISNVLHILINNNLMDVVRPKETTFISKHFFVSCCHKHGSCNPYSNKIKLVPTRHNVSISQSIFAPHPHTRTVVWKNFKLRKLVQCECSHILYNALK